MDNENKYEGNLSSEKAWKESTEQEAEVNNWNWSYP